MHANHLTSWLCLQVTNLKYLQRETWNPFDRLQALDVWSEGIERIQAMVAVAQESPEKPPLYSLPSIMNPPTTQWLPNKIMGRLPQQQIRLFRQFRLS